MSAQPYYFSYLALMITNLDAMLDSGEYNNISVDDIKLCAKAGDMAKFLAANATGEFASELLLKDPDFASWYLVQLRDRFERSRTREHDRRGLDLLISYTAEILNEHPH